MRRRGKVRAVYAAVILCVVAGFLAQRLFGGGTVRSAARGPPAAAGPETAAVGSESPRPARVAGPGVTFAAVGDTMLGNTPSFPPTPAPTSTR